MVSWSGGKDSSLALEKILIGDELEVAGLLSTVTSGYDRVSMHGVRTDLLRAQCAALDLPLFEVRIPPSCSNAEYEHAFIAAVRQMQQRGINDIVFGDLFLADIRGYRETLLAPTGARSHFPLWGEDTRDLAAYFISAGFRAVLVTVDPAQIDARFCGCEFDADLLRSLPASADPCGERGEFHTFVYDGPIFKSTVQFGRNGVIHRGGFYFCDLQALGADPQCSTKRRTRGSPTMQSQQRP